MPDAAAILETLQRIVDQGKGASPFVRVLTIALVVFFVGRRRVSSAILAGFIAVILVTAATLAVVFEDTDLLVFAVLFPLGLIWGREALILPADARPKPLRIAVASVLGLAAFFYPRFVEGAIGVILLAPLGIVPCPTLIFACAGIVVSQRSFSLLSVISTWVVSAFFGVVGVFYLDVKLDWILTAAVPISIAAYFMAAPQTGEKRKRLRRRH